MGKNKKKSSNGNKTDVKPENSPPPSNTETQGKPLGEEEDIHTETNGKQQENDVKSQKEEESDESTLQLNPKEPVLNGKGGHSSSDEVAELQSQLKKSEEEKQKIQAAYDNLLSKLGGMKSVFSKMKESQVELEETTQKLEQVVVEKKQLEDKLTLQTSENNKIKQESLALNGECDRLSQQLTQLRREFQLKDETLLDEKYDLENTNARLTKKITELKSEMQELQLVIDELQVEKKSQIQIIDELNDSLKRQEIETSSLKSNIGKLESTILAKEEEIAELVKKHQVQIEQESNEKARLIDDVAQVNQKLIEKEEKIEEMRNQVSKITELETDINNKQLIIGKLRHEAVILNEHLTKSLTMIKQQSGSLKNTIDKELISNVVVSFLQFQRGDPKKFEALQLISALLDWDDLKKIAAGLLHGSSTKTAISGTGRQSFVSLWTEFLEKESNGESK